MMKAYGSSVLKPLVSLYRNCFENVCFPKEWEKASIVPVHKKTYRPVSLLSICANIFEKGIFNSIL